MNKFGLVSILAIISVALLMQSAECSKIDNEIDFFDEELLQETDIDSEEEPICICTREYNPLCASNGKTYGNDCLFRCEADTPRGQRTNLRILHRGDCPN